MRAPPARGFTLMELMVALSIGLVVMAGATSAIVSITRSTVQTRQQSRADIEAKLLIDWVASALQEVGGGSVRPNMAIRIEDDCASETVVVEGLGTVTLPDCDESDRLNYLILDDSAPQCESNTTPGANIFFNSTSECCQAGNTDLDGRTVLVVDDDGDWTTRFCSNQNITGCHCTFPSGLSAYNPPGGGLDPPVVVTRGSSATVYMDPADHVLKMLVDSDGDGDVELRELAPNIYDFQATLLWDTDSDGSPETASVSTPAGAQPNTLRMARIGLVVGVPVPSKTTPTRGQVLNGPTRTADRGLMMRSVVVTTGLRNLYVFY